MASLQHAIPHFVGTRFLLCASLEVAQGGSGRAGINPRAITDWYSVRAGRAERRPRGAEAAVVRAGRAERRSRKAGSRKACYSIGKVQRREKCVSGEPRCSIQRMRCLEQQRTFATGTIFLPLATGQASQTLILTVCRCRTPHRKVSRTYTFTAPTNIPTARTKQSPENRPNQPQSETSLCKHQRIRSRRTTETHGLRASPAPTSKPRIRHLVLKDTIGKDRDGRLTNE